VAYRFERDNLYDDVPDVVGRYFRAMIQLNRNRNQRIRDEALQVASAFNAIEVTPLFFKGGAGLLSGLYRDPGIRTMSDLDVLVPENRVQDCAACLTRIGYSRSSIEPHPASYCFGTYGSASSCAPIDLHWQALSHPHEILLAASDLFASAVELRQGDAVFAAPCDTHGILLNIGHGQLKDHAYLYGRLPLRALHDFSLMLERAGDLIDWRDIERRFAARRNRTALGFHLLAARLLLDAKPIEASGPTLGARVLLSRARVQNAHPGTQRLSDRFVRVFLLLKRELSRGDLRRRLLGHARSAAWWRRHLKIFWRGGPY